MQSGREGFVRVYIFFSRQAVSMESYRLTEIPAQCQNKIFEIKHTFQSIKHFIIIACKFTLKSTEK